MAGWAAGALMLVVALVAKQFVGEPSWVDTFALALGSALLLGWANGAVGIIGSENNKANLMYGGVLVVGAIGAVVARFKPEGMARALFATALAQTLVTMIALVGRMGSPYTGPLEIVTINGFFVALFVGSAALFSKVARGRAAA